MDFNRLPLAVVLITDCVGKGKSRELGWRLLRGPGEMVVAEASVGAVEVGRTGGILEVSGRWSQRNLQKDCLWAMRRGQAGL